jgi:hypothetical protein
MLIKDVEKRCAVWYGKRGRRKRRSGGRKEYKWAK